MINLDCSLPDGYGKRILVGVESQLNDFKIAFINDNTILNNYEYGENSYKKIVNANNGFNILFEFGSIIWCEYKFFFNTTHDSIPYLQTSEYRCFNKGHPDLYDIHTEQYDEKEYYIDTLNLKNLIKIPNLLKDN